jgi:hypothetical protein
MTIPLNDLLARILSILDPDEEHGGDIPPYFIIYLESIDPEVSRSPAFNACLSILEILSSNRSFTFPSAR